MNKFEKTIIISNILACLKQEKIDFDYVTKLIEKLKTLQDVNNLK